jgi:hypothetical protein
VASEDDGTFAEYLTRRGYSMDELTTRFVTAMARRPENITSFYKREYPEEWLAWQTKKRILG